MEEQQAERSAALLSAMANPVRLEILMLLVRRETPVGGIVSYTGLSQSAVSQHLSKLRRQRLVATRRDAQTIYYSSESLAVRAMLQALEEIFAVPS